MFSMGVETIGEAYKQGWRVHARCGQGKYSGMKAIPLCTHNEETTYARSFGRAAPRSHFHYSPAE